MNIFIIWLFRLSLISSRKKHNNKQKLIRFIAVNPKHLEFLKLFVRQFDLNIFRCASKDKDKKYLRKNNIGFEWVIVENKKKKSSIIRENCVLVDYTREESGSSSILIIRSGQRRTFEPQPRRIIGFLSFGCAKEDNYRLISIHILVCVCAMTYRSYPVHA